MPQKLTDDVGHVAAANEMNGIAGQLRSIIRSAIDQHVYETAISFATQLTQLPEAEISDFVLFAKCFSLTGEYRRCLATLEHRGLLAADNLLRISRLLSIKSDFGAVNEDSQELKHIISAVQLAAHCLLSLKEYQDCLTLLSPLTNEIEFIHKDESHMHQLHERSLLFASDIDTDINPIAVMYNIAGRCVDMLENRSKAQQLLVASLRIDVACVQSLDYLMSNGLIGQREKTTIVEGALAYCEKRNLKWLESYYMSILHQDTAARGGFTTDKKTQTNAIVLAKRAEYMYDRCRPEEAYRLAREAYIIDPFDWNGGILVYIVSMVELGLKAELFYLGHELAQSHPGQAVTWYCIGCYYWCCKKLSMAQAYLQKATKIDKRFSRAWVALGHVLVAAEDSEHAISAYRTACRLLPGDHRAPTYMAKELLRTNSSTLAIHILQGALRLCPDDPVTLNELGVSSMALGDLDEALAYFESAVRLVSQHDGSFKYADSEEIMCNYGTCLRRADLLQDALMVFQRCLAMNPRSTENHLNIGFTLHLMKRFSEAIECYHTVLGFEPAHSFCTEMLNNAIEDSLYFGTPSDKGPVNLIFGITEHHVNGINEIDDMPEVPGLSPLVSSVMKSQYDTMTEGSPRALFGDESGVGNIHEAMETSPPINDSRSGFLGLSGFRDIDTRSASGVPFRLHGGELHSSFNESGSVVPFPGFGGPTTGPNTSARGGHDSVSSSTLHGVKQVESSFAAARGLFSSIESNCEDNSVRADYSPYSYMLALGGPRRISLSQHDNAGGDTTRQGVRFHDDIATTNLSAMYFDDAGSGGIADSDQSVSVISYSRVTGNLSLSIDNEDDSRDTSGGLR